MLVLHSSSGLWFRDARWTADWKSAIRQKAILRYIKGPRLRRLLRQGFEHGVVSRLRLTRAVEEQGIIHSPPRKVVQPAFAIVQVPERDACNNVTVLPENAEELGVLLCLSLQNLTRAAVPIGVKLREFVAVFAAVGPP